MKHVLPRLHQDRFASGGITGLKITQAITDENSLRQVEIIIAGSLEEQAWFGFATATAVFFPMRANVYPVNLRRLFFKFSFHLPVNLIEVTSAHQTPGNTPLIGYYMNIITVSGEQCQSFDRSGEELELSPVFYIITFRRFLVNHPVTVEKHHFLLLDVPFPHHIEFFWLLPYFSIIHICDVSG